MKRRTLLIELVLLVGLCTWLGLRLTDQAPRPPGSIDIKVQLSGAQDKAYLYQAPDGTYRYKVTPDSGPQFDLSAEDFAARLYRDQNSRSWLAVLLNISSRTGMAWVGLGLLGQVLFTGRMVVQWLASEKTRRSVVPPAFWWMSLAGATMLLSYFLWRKDAVGVLGQGFGWFIYVRNLWLIYRERKGDLGAGEDPAPEPELGSS